ncbi:MAG: phosphomannomutase/phosphoglucomutase [Planctomycetota bacterium]|nr:MAG: phosphomannomutase/phosphoglucomutase [Planctomycetota bacterium]
MSVFKAYDIRGVYPDELNEDLAQRIGRAFADFLGAGPIAVGRDMRASAPAIQEACMRGIQDGGRNVIDLGLTSTPQAYFAIGHLGAAGGLNTTASHNPARYIGFKLCREEAKPISADSGIREIEKMARSSPPPVRSPRGQRTKRDTLDAYAAHVSGWADFARPVRLASDAANGMAAHTFPAVLKNLPQIEHHGLYYQLDGRFPNHEANPLKDSTLRDLGEHVRRTKAELGAAFDGDADRCRFLDETGRPVGNDIVTALVAREVLAKEPGAAIIYDLRSSWVLPEEIRKAGGVPVRERVGHSFLKARMREHQAPFGGELSGHYYFRDNWYADNAEIMLLQVLSLLSRSDRPFSAMLAELQRYHSTGEINFHVPDPRAAIAQIKRQFADGRQDELDGVTIRYGELGTPGWWWFNLRPSNTEPLLRMVLEADTRARMEDMSAKLISALGVKPEAH